MVQPGELGCFLQDLSGPERMIMDSQMTTSKKKGKTTLWIPPVICYIAIEAMAQSKVL